MGPNAVCPNPLEPVNMLLYMAKGIPRLWIKLRILRWGNCPGLSGCLDVIARSHEREAERSEEM